jgi:hypothetical protein
MIMVHALLMAGVSAAEIRSYPLDERSVYSVRLSREAPTTCVFPGALKAMVGANVSTRPDENPGILLSHEGGTEYFSLRSLKENAAGALNILYQGKVYALVLTTGVEPDRAVVFLNAPVAGGTTAPASTEVLRPLLERTKQIERGAIAGMSPAVERALPGNVTAYREFTATVESVVRFESEDALVFRIRLENSLAVPVPYDPLGLAVRLGREFFPAACTDASGAIPPKGRSIVYLVIAGAPGGGRANLSVREKFNVIVPQP